MQTYVERDVRQMVNVRDLRTFHRFLRLCAGRNGQLLNLSNLAGECGITHNTAKAWISILEASYVPFLLPPHHGQSVDLDSERPATRHAQYAGCDL